MVLWATVAGFEDRLKLVDAELEDDRLVKLLPALKAFPLFTHPHTRLRVEAVGDSPLSKRPEWVDWMRRFPPSQRSVRLTQDDGGVDTWVFVTPFQRSPEEERFTWLTVAALQLPVLRESQQSASRPELVRLLNDIATKKALRPKDDEDDQGDEEAEQPKWDPLSNTLVAASKELRQDLLVLKKVSFNTPAEVRGCLLGEDGAIAKGLLDRWRCVLKDINLHLSNDLGLLIETIDAAKDQLEDWGRRTGDDVGVDGALEYLKTLIRVTVQFLSSLRVERFIRSRPYIPVSFDVLANQIAGEIRVFQEAARAAAVHQGVFGTLVENHVRSLIERWIRPCSLSSGAIAGLRFPNQVDGIIWDHRVAPALVEQGDVAVVSAMTVLGIFELKASKNEDLASFSSRIDDLREHLRVLRNQNMVLRLRGAEVPVLGILIRSTMSYGDVRVLTGQNVTVLLCEDVEENLHVNVEGVYDVLHFIFQEVNPRYKT